MTLCRECSRTLTPCFYPFSDSSAVASQIRPASRRSLTCVASLTCREATRSENGPSCVSSADADTPATAGTFERPSGIVTSVCEPQSAAPWRLLRGSRGHQARPPCRLQREQDAQHRHGVGERGCSASSIHTRTPGTAPSNGACSPSCPTRASRSARAAARIVATYDEGPGWSPSSRTCTGTRTCASPPLATSWRSSFVRWAPTPAAGGCQRGSRDLYAGAVYRLRPGRRPARGEARAPARRALHLHRARRRPRRTRRLGAVAAPPSLALVLRGLPDRPPDRAAAWRGRRSAGHLRGDHRA